MFQHMPVLKRFAWPSEAEASPEAWVKTQMAAGTGSHLQVIPVGTEVIQDETQVLQVPEAAAAEPRQ